MYVSARHEPYVVKLRRNRIGCGEKMMSSVRGTSLLACSLFSCWLAFSSQKGFCVYITLLYLLVLYIIMATVATSRVTDPLAPKRGLGRLLSRTQSSRRVVMKSSASTRSLPTSSSTNRSYSNDTLSLSTSSASSRPIVSSRSSFRRSNNNNKSTSKSVRFKSVQIREHGLMPTINPSVTSGPALGLAWEYNDLPTYSLQSYEQTRPTRRTRAEFQMPQSVRVEILRQEGFSRKEIQETVRAINIARKQRRATVMTQEVEELHLAVEWVGRKVKKAIGARSTSTKEEAQLWKNAQKKQTKQVSLAGMLDPPEEVETKKTTKRVVVSKKSKNRVTSKRAVVVHDNNGDVEDDECMA